MPALTEEQVAFFNREGYLIVEDVLTDADLQPVIEEIGDEVHRRALALVESGELSRSFAEEGFSRCLACISAETDTVARAIWNGNLAGPAFFHLISHPKLLDIAEQFCGSELIASSVYRLRPKIPHYGYGAVPWHQDSGYFEPYCDNALVLTMWVPLVDANVENGCLWVLPGVHHGEVLRHQQHPIAYLEIPEQELPLDRKPVCCPVKKGGILLLANKTPHVSYENNTEDVRWSMDLRYQSASLPTNAVITRLPEETIGVPEKGIPVACYPPEADFLVRSATRPEEVVRDPAVFKQLRETHVYRPVTNRWSK